MGKELEKQEWEIIADKLEEIKAECVESICDETTELEPSYWIDIYKVNNQWFGTISFENGSCQLLKSDQNASTVDKLAFIESLASEVNDGSN